MKIKKKGTSGNAKNFITRTQAVKKLQVSLADFRRLCIFKGIYPREPRNKKKANKGSTAPVTFYYAKDIQYLLHEPILVKFREHKTFAKKLQRALGRGEVNDAQRLESNRPKMKLNHVIKERYPTFLDALRDLDDPLNMLFLFSTMPATDKVSHRVTKDAEKLSNQWLAYVSKEKLLRKVFVSIKGVYYEALVKGQEVRWLVPFKFPTNIPSDVDFRIMLTFLEFYSTLLHFTLFKLYSDANLIYPPTIETEKLKGIGGLSSFVLQTKEQGANALLPSKVKEDENSTEEGKTLDQEELNKALKADEQVTDDANNASDVEVEESNNAELDDFHQENSKSDSLLQPSRFGSPTASLFSNLIFYVGREVALDVLEFCVLSCGGSLISEIALDDLKVNQPEEYEKLDLSNVTHQIVDRPKIIQKVPGRTYLQPQWIFDCINKGELIPVNEYAPGEPLPPHLSPWGDAGAYDPQAVTKSNAEETKEEVEEKDKDEEEEEQEEKNDDEEEGTQEEEDKDEEEDEEEEEEEEDEDLKAQKELEVESAGVKFSDLPEAKGSKKSKKRSSNAIEDEEKELKKIMMTNKQRKLYNKMQYGIDKKRAREEELTKKKKKLDKAKKQLNKK